MKKPKWLQSLTEQKSYWPSRAEVGDLSRCIPAVSDDGSHFNDSPFYFEWWYFDAAFDNGSAIAIIIHLTDLIRAASENGSLNVVVFGRDQSVVRRFVPYRRQEISASSEMCDVRIGKTHCWGDGESYKIYLEEPDIRMELVFRSVSSAWRPGNGGFRFGDGSAFFSWIVPQPRAKVEGVITVAGKGEQVKGWGYHDHNWGTISLLDVIKDWSWGRIYCDDCAFVFADIRLSRRYGGSRLMPFSIIRGNDVIISSFLGRSELLDFRKDFLSCPQMPVYPSGWHMTFDDPYTWLDLVIESQHIMERADLLSGNSLRRLLIEKLIAHPYYIRCLVAAKGRWRIGGKEQPVDGYGIFEQMTFGR